MKNPIPIGKLPAEHLVRLLAQHTRPDPRLIIGARLGEDAAVIDMGDRYLVAKTDPITFVGSWPHCCYLKARQTSPWWRPSLPRWQRHVSGWM
jgi:selenophosphate synthetase-related protein